MSVLIHPSEILVQILWSRNTAVKQRNLLLSSRVRRTYRYIILRSKSTAVCSYIYCAYRQEVKFCTGILLLNTLLPLATTMSRRPDPLIPPGPYPSKLSLEIYSAAARVLEPVSYTHLTLPTIYSV